MFFLTYRTRLRGAFDRYRPGGLTTSHTCSLWVNWSFHDVTSKSNIKQPCRTADALRTKLAAPTALCDTNHDRALIHTEYISTL